MRWVMLVGGPLDGRSFRIEDECRLLYISGPTRADGMKPMARYHRREDEMSLADFSEDWMATADDMPILPIRKAEWPASVASRGS